MRALVLAAGKGTRMISDAPKVLHEILGKSVLEHVLTSLRQAGAKEFFVVVGNGAKQVCSLLDQLKRDRGWKIRAVHQKVQKGTGHAVMMCEKSMKSIQDNVLICPGDMPLLQAETIRSFLKEHQQSRSRASILSAVRQDPSGYGRILKSFGGVDAIREELDATDEERAIQEVNTGVYLFSSRTLFGALGKIRPQNKKNEFYLTDVIEILGNEGEKPQAFALASSEEGQGINTRKDLAVATEIINRHEIEAHMKRGVTFILPEQTVVSPGVKIGKDTVIYPWTYIESNVKIGRHCKIGPHAKLRSGTSIGDRSVIGSFVEVSRTKIGKSVYAKHLAYLGDAVVGDETNIGAGTITANFDGKSKHQTKIGKKNRIGSNTVLVAPIKLGDRVQTGAGAVLTGGKTVQSGQIMVGVPAKPLVLKRKRKA